jgi:hypothetical protein
MMFRIDWSANSSGWGTSQFIHGAINPLKRTMQFSY